MSERIVVLDLETSGLDATRHAILEMGAVMLDGWSLERLDEFACEVCFPYWLEWDDGAEGVHGLSYAQATDLSRTPEHEAYRRLMAWLDRHRCGKCLVMAGMNPGFDLAFLRAVASRCGPSALHKRISHRTLDLHSLAWSYAWRERPGMDRGSLHTDAIYELLGRKPEARPHRALEGARREAEALALLLSR